MRGRQFGQLQSDLRAELGRNNDPGVRAADLPQIQQVLRRVYETTYDEYDWPHLNQIHARILMAAGQRYYDFPDTCDYDKVETGVVWYNGQPSPLIRGINWQQYAVYDSEADERCDPVERWDVRYVAGVPQMEVWPIPSTNTVSVQFEGKRKFVPLVDDANLCLLDDILIVLRAAAEIAPKDTQIKLKLNAAEDRAGIIKNRTKAAGAPFRLGLDPVPTKPNRVTVRIAGA